jgi:ribosomal protein L7/L12
MSSEEKKIKKETVRQDDKFAKLLEIIDSLSVQDSVDLAHVLRSRYSLEDLQLDSSQSSGSQSVSLFLDDIGSLSRIETIKVLSAVLGLGVSESREVLTQLPYCILENVSTNEAEEKIQAFNAVKTGLNLKIR